MITSYSKLVGASFISTNAQQLSSASRKLSSSIVPSSTSAIVTSLMSSFSSPTTSSSPIQTDESTLGPPLATINRRCVSAPTPIPFSSVDHRKASPNLSVASPSLTKKIQSRNRVKGKKNCKCSPSTLPGSFRCRLHKNQSARKSTCSKCELYFQSHRLYLRKKAIKNSILRNGKVEGDLEKRALASLIRKLPHQKKRRSAFQPKPSRLSVMSRAGD